MKIIEAIANSSDSSKPQNGVSSYSIPQQHSRFWMTCLLLVSDTISLIFAGLTAVGIRYQLGSPIGLLPELLEPSMYWTLLPIVAACVGVYAIRGLYPCVGVGPVEELRRITSSSVLVLLSMTGVTFWLRSAERYSRMVIIIALFTTIIFVPLCRWLVRWLGVRMRSWGELVAIIGVGPHATRVAQFLLSHPEYGMQPFAFITDLEDRNNEHILPIISGFGDINSLYPTLKINTAIFIPSELSVSLRDELLSYASESFRHLVVISDLSWIGSLGVTAFDLQGMVGLEIHQNLLIPWQQAFKRTVDIILSTLLGVITFPLLVMIGILVKIDSPGNIFFKQKRIGKGMREINVLKFRTMYLQCDKILTRYLRENPSELVEWDKTHKLSKDPRVTRIGRLLRRSSLDEIPQLWNVLLGEMSLVGPRPFIPAEIEHYQKSITLYQRVRPGITGLWQVSGRGSLSFPERIQLDEYYVRNWSIWLDIYIMLKTTWIVLRGDGAY